MPSTQQATYSPSEAQETTIEKQTTFILEFSFIRNRVSLSTTCCQQHTLIRKKAGLCMTMPITRTKKILTTFDQFTDRPLFHVQFSLMIAFQLMIMTRPTCSTNSFSLCLNQVIFHLLTPVSTNSSYYFG